MFSFMSGLFCSSFCLWALSILIHVVTEYSFSFLNSIPLTIPSLFHYTAGGDLDCFRFLGTIIVLLLTFLQLYLGEHVHTVL